MLELQIAFMLQSVGTLFLLAGGFTSAMLVMILFTRTLYEAWGGE